MKKIFSAIAIIASLIFAMSAMAMQSINDNELSKVTGQSGVSMGLNATVDVTFDIIAWGDSDGFGTTYNSAGWVGLYKGSVSTLTITPRQDGGMLTLADAGAIIALYTGSTPVIPANYKAILKEIADDEGTLYPAAWKELAKRVILSNEFLTIDVGSNSSSQTKVHIGLPTAWITMASFDATAGLWTNGTTTKLANFQELGTLYVGTMDIKVGQGGYVDIYAAGASGITMEVGATISSLTINSLSWGDKNGIGVASDPTDPTVPRADAGFVGLTDLAITNLKLTGLKATINVATAFNNAGVWAGDLKESDRNTIFYYTSQAGRSGSTWVDLAIEGTVGIGTMFSNVALGTAKALDGPTATAPQVLGQLYISNLNATIANGSWVTILAH